MSDAPLFMLDTNIASFILREASPPLQAKLRSIPLSHQTISVVTEAELRFRVARRPQAKKLAALVENFIAHVTVLPWTSDSAVAYARLRATLEARGASLGNMDMLIAAHALSLSATLVTNDAALLRLAPLLKTVDWTAGGSATPEGVDGRRARD
jgi:tRNA(fMet)-specific endonuclease VapC